MRSVDLALSRLRQAMALRGVEGVAERIAAHHGVTLLDVFGGSDLPAAVMARRDTVKALALRGVKLSTLAEWLGVELEEAGELMLGDRYQGSRIAAALGWGQS